MTIGTMEEKRPARAESFGFYLTDNPQLGGRAGQEPTHCRTCRQRVQYDPLPGSISREHPIDLAPWQLYDFTLRGREPHWMTLAKIAVMRGDYGGAIGAVAPDLRRQL